MKKEPGEYGIAFLIGFFLYTMLEIMGRGYTHWTMGIAAGAAMAVLYAMEHRLQASRITKALLGAGFVTAAEFTVGVYDNLIMGWDVWDYSDMHFQILGQVSLLFSLLWAVLCYFAIGLCSSLYAAFHPEEAKTASGDSINTENIEQ